MSPSTIYMGCISDISLFFYFSSSESTSIIKSGLTSNLAFESLFKVCSFFMKAFIYLIERIKLSNSRSLFKRLLPSS